MSRLATPLLIVPSVSSAVLQGARLLDDLIGEGSLELSDFVFLLGLDLLVVLEHVFEE